MNTSLSHIGVLDFEVPIHVACLSLFAFRSVLKTTSTRDTLVGESIVQLRYEMWAWPDVASVIVTYNKGKQSTYCFIEAVVRTTSFGTLATPDGIRAMGVEETGRLPGTGGRGGIKF